MVGPAFKGVRWLGALAVGDVENPGFPGLERGHDRGGLADDRENAVASPPKSGSNAAEAIGLPLIECSRWEERSGPPAILTDTDFLKSRAAHGGAERSERRT